MANYIVIGGVAGGASTAARLRRNDEHAHIVLVERGAYISYANCGLPYYTGTVIAERSKLFVMTPQSFQETLNIDVRINTEATAIDPKSKTVTLIDTTNGKTYQEPYDELILSPGAEPIRPPIPGMDLEGIFTLRTVPDADAIKAWLDTLNPERAVVVGGGFIGLEMAENLAHRGVKVAIVEALEQVMAPLDFEMAAIVHRHLREKGLELRLRDGVKAFEKQDNRILVRLASGDTMLTDMVLLSVGIRPDTKLAQDAGIATIPAGKPGAGAILVDEHFHTNLPYIRAIGDAVAFKNPITGEVGVVPLAGPANKQGRLVADAVVYGDEKTPPWKGTLATSIAKIFDLTVAATGANEKVLDRIGKPHTGIIVHPNNHAGYYPGVVPLSLKVVFDPESGRLYGAQAVGYDGVDKRIDVLSALIGKKGTVADLTEFDQAYAPPYSSAKDPVNMAGFVADNVLAGRSHLIDYREFEKLRSEGAFVLDVRTLEEFELGHIPGAICIPNTELRKHLSELPKDKIILIYCSVGLRGYLSERILRQNGWSSVYNLSGGYKTWQVVMEKQDSSGALAAQAALYGTTQQGLQYAMTAYREGTGMPEQKIINVDACGLQCPGPIMRLKNEIDAVEPGTRIIITASDPGFSRDVQSWANLTGNLLISLEEKGGTIQAVIEKGATISSVVRKAEGQHSQQDSEGFKMLQTSQGATFIVFSNDFDKILAAFVLANGAVAVGKQVTMFFTFWGLSVIKRPEKPSVHKDFMGRMFGIMLPKHAGKLSLSKMNFAGMGVQMMKSRMKAKNVDQLEQMIQSSIASGVRMVACQMSMDIMGITKEEFIDGIEVGGVATYMEAASKSGVNLFI